MQALKSFWDKQSPKNKRFASIAAIGGGLFLMVFVFGSAPQESSRKNRQENEVRSLLTDASTRELSIDSLSASVKHVNRENEELKKELEKLNLDLNRKVETLAKAAEVERELKVMQRQLESMQRKSDSRFLETQADFDKKIDQVSETANANVEPTIQYIERESDGDSTGGAQEPKPELPPKEQAARDLFSKAPEKQVETDPNTGERKPLKIVSYAQPQPELEIEDEDANSVYMPAGSILTGVLLNGLDAPTGQGARKDPFPVTVRIQKEAILPNHFQADVRECFALAAGYGDLSTERVFLRGETISCIREDGGVIESRINSYVNGEDGKAGIRGRLVSKQGQVIAKSMVAGFLSGAANAFDVEPVPVISTSSSGRTQYQETFDKALVQGAAMKGASTALDRVAQFYMDLADAMTPVIEINAGREVDIVLTGGLNLKIRKQKP